MVRNQPIALNNYSGVVHSEHSLRYAAYRKYPGSLLEINL